MASPLTSRRPLSDRQRRLPLALPASGSGEGGHEPTRLARRRPGRHGGHRRRPPRHPRPRRHAGDASGGGQVHRALAILELLGDPESAGSAARRDPRGPDVVRGRRDRPHARAGQVPGVPAAPAPRRRRVRRARGRDAALPDRHPTVLARRPRGQPTPARRGRRARGARGRAARRAGRGLRAQRGERDDRGHRRPGQRAARRRLGRAHDAAVVHRGRSRPAVRPGHRRRRPPARPRGPGRDRAGGPALARRARRAARRGPGPGLVARPPRDGPGPARGRRPGARRRGCRVVAAVTVGGPDSRIDPVARGGEHGRAPRRRGPRGRPRRAR